MQKDLGDFGDEGEEDRMTDQNEEGDDEEQDDNNSEHVDQQLQRSGAAVAEEDSLLARYQELEKKINEGYTKRSYLNEETGLNLQELTCNYCQIKYGKLSNMKDHIRTHLAVKMFKC